MLMRFFVLEQLLLCHLWEASPTRVKGKSCNLISDLDLETGRKVFFFLALGNWEETMFKSLCTGLIEVLSILHLELKWLCIYTVFGHRTLNSSAMKCIMDRLMVSMSMTQYDYTISTPKDKLQFLYTNFHFSQSSNWILFYFIFCFCIYWLFRLCQSSTSIKSHYFSHPVCIDCKRSCFNNTWFWSKTIFALFNTLKEKKNQ